MGLVAKPFASRLAPRKSEVSALSLASASCSPLLEFSGRHKILVAEALKEHLQCMFDLVVVPSNQGVLAQTCPSLLPSGMMVT